MYLNQSRLTAIFKININVYFIILYALHIYVCIHLYTKNIVSALRVCTVLREYINTHDKKRKRDFNNLSAHTHYSVTHSSLVDHTKI